MRIPSEVSAVSKKENIAIFSKRYALDDRTKQLLHDSPTKIVTWIIDKGLHAGVRNASAYVTKTVRQMTAEAEEAQAQAP